MALPIFTPIRDRRHPSHELLECLAHLVILRNAKGLFALRADTFAARVFVADGLSALALLTSAWWILRTGALGRFLGRDNRLDQGRIRGGVLIGIDRSSSDRNVSRLVYSAAVGSRIMTSVAIELLVGVYG